jgi:hypothetical protein
MYPLHLDALAAVTAQRAGSARSRVAVIGSSRGGLIAVKVAALAQPCWLAIRATPTLTPAT